MQCYWPAEISISTTTEREISKPYPFYSSLMLDSDSDYSSYYYDYLTASVTKIEHPYRIPAFSFLSSYI